MPASFPSGLRRDGRHRDSERSAATGAAAVRTRLPGRDGAGLTLRDRATTFGGDHRHQESGEENPARSGSIQIGLAAYGRHRTSS
jgi:hypothetical protein